MSVTITVPKGYMGQCMCGKDAKHKVWMEFTNPSPHPQVLVDAGIPQPKGIWHNVCDDCLKPTDKVQEET